jgi:predicted GTPase
MNSTAKQKAVSSSVHVLICTHLMCTSFLHTECLSKHTLSFGEPEEHTCMHHTNACKYVQALPPPKVLAEEEREMPLAVAIVGRPNVGKSSLVNAITGIQRSIVSDMSGTTRDAIDTEVVLPDGTPMTLIDTAGIRRRSKVASSSDGAEPMSVARAIRALRRADVVAIMIDPQAGITIQDYRCVLDSSPPSPAVLHAT